MLGKAADFMLGKNEFVVGSDIKDAFATFDEFGGHPSRFLDRSHQTGGLG